MKIVRPAKLAGTHQEIVKRRESLDIKAARECRPKHGNGTEVDP
jgi:hypothetical protein